MIDATKAQALAQAHVGLESSLEFLDRPPDGLYLVAPENNFYFAVGRPRVSRVGGVEIAVVDRATGTVTVTCVGD
ncbi:MAG: hypothetical protein M0Q42_03220 [Xanthomonadales bacterium]|nr:hypothetical protein [Xanthomonadales bacterium]